MTNIKTNCISPTISKERLDKEFLYSLYSTFRYKDTITKALINNFKNSVKKYLDNTNTPSNSILYTYIEERVIEQFLERTGLTIPIDATDIPDDFEATEINDKESHEYNAADSIDNEVMYTLSHIPKIVNGKISLNSFGTIEYHDEGEVWKALLYVGNNVFNKGRIDFKAFSNAIKQHTTTFPLLNDVLNENLSNMFIQNIIGEKAKSDLQYKLISTIARPIMTFVNFTIDSFGDNTELSTYISNEISKEDYRRTLINKLKENKNLILLTDKEDYVWNIDNLKQYFNYDVNEKVWVLERGKVAAFHKELGINVNTITDDVKKKVNNYFNSIIKSSVVLDGDNQELKMNVNFKADVFNIYSKAMKDQREQAIERYALSFITKNFKKLYAAVNINHQIRMQRMYRGIGIINMANEIETFKEGIIELEKQDPIFKYLPYIQFIKSTNTDTFKRILLNNKYSIVDTLVNNNENESPHNFDAIKLLKFRLMLSAPTLQTFQGDVRGKDDLSRYREFPFYSVTNSSNKTNKIVSGIEYRDIKGNYRKQLNLENSIVKSEVNRIIHYTTKLLEVIADNRKVKRYKNNDFFRKVMNMYALVSNHQKEINSLMFVKVDDVQTLSEEQKEQLKELTDVLPNTKYFTIEGNRVKVKDDSLYTQINTIYEQQIALEIKHLQSEIINNGLFIDTDDKEVSLIERLKFLPAEYIYNQLPSEVYTATDQFIPSGKKGLSDNRKLLNILLVLATKYKEYNFIDAIEKYNLDLKDKTDANKVNVNSIFDTLTKGEDSTIEQPLWYQKSSLEKHNISLYAPVTYDILLKLLSKINRNLADNEKKYYLRSTDKSISIIQFNEDINLQEIAKNIFEAYTEWYHYNYVFNMYDDIQLTLGDMSSYFKKDKETRWNVETTFTNFYKRAKLVISPIVPHADNVTLNGVSYTNFKNIILKSNKTYSPQARETTINLNRQVFENIAKNINTDTQANYNRLIEILLGNDVDLTGTNIYEYNSKLSAKEQRDLNASFLMKYNNPPLKKEIDAMFQEYGINTSYFSIDLTDAYDVGTLMFELKRMLLYNTNNSIISQSLADRLTKWLEEPLKTTITIFGVTYHNPKRRYTTYNLDDFRKELVSKKAVNELVEFDNLVLYLRKDITVGFLSDDTLNNRTLFTDKNAMRILLPTDIAGTPLELLRVFMEIHDIDRASHDSAIKTPLSAAYAIDFWKTAKNNDALTTWNTLKEETSDNVLTIPFTHIGEQTAQTHSDKSILSSQSKSLIFIAQKTVEYLHKYINGVYTNEGVEAYTGEELYEQLQDAWGNIYKHKIADFAREVYVNGEVNTEKLAEFILHTLKVSNNLKEEDVISLLTNKQLLIEELQKLKGDEELSENPNDTAIAKVNELINILTNNELLADDIKKLELINSIVDLKVKNNGFTDVANINNWLLKFVIPIFYNTNANKMDSVLASKINNLLRLKGNGVKGALTPNVDIVETKYITGDLTSSLVIVDPNDWTPDMELQSTSVRDGKVTPDQIAVSWNFKDNKEVFFEYLTDDKGNYLLDSKGNRRSMITDNHYSKITKYQRIKVDIDQTIHPAYDSTKHKEVVYQYSGDGKTYYSLITKEKVELDILDFCKPEEEGHTITNGNNTITYPVLDLNRVPKQMLQGFANRIPTQSPNSMSYFQIAAFFHNKTRSTVAAPAEFIVRMGSDFDIDTLYSLIYNGYYDVEDRAFKLYTDKKDDKSAYNKVLDIYITVLTNPSNLQLILAPLDFGISHGKGGGTPLQISKQTLIQEIEDKGAIEVLNNYGTAATIAKLSQSDNFTYNPLSSLTNHLKYVAALSSGAGIGWAALHQVFNTLVELKGKDVFANVKYRNSIVDEDGKVIELNKDISIPYLVYNMFGNLKGMDRSTKVSIFVDNEKEQIADRTNMTTFTLNAIAGFNAMGLDIAHIQAIISTPFIKELEKNTIELGRIQGLYKTLFDYDYPNVSFDNNVQKYKLSTNDTTLEKLIESDNTTPQTFDLKTLLLYIGNNKDVADEDKYKKVGLEILLLYYEAARLGGELSAIQTLLNTDAQGAGKSYSNIVQKYRKLEDIFSEKIVTNILSVFGDTYYMNYTPSIRIYDSNFNKYSEPYDIISLYINGLVSTINSVKYVQGTTVEEIATTKSFIDNYEGAINNFVDNTQTTDYGSKSSTLFNILLTIHKNNKEANVLPILKYLLLSHRFRPYTFAKGEVGAILKHIAKKERPRVVAMLKGISNNVDYVFIDNLLFYPTSHKGYALLALKLGVDTFKDFFPYGTSVWNNTLDTIYFKTGKRLSKEEDLIAFTKLFRAFNILKNNTVNNDYLTNTTIGKQMVIAVAKANKDTYYFLNSVNIESRSRVIITYTKTDNLVDEVTYFEKVHNLFKDMLLDDTLIEDTNIKYKDLANYLAEYYLLVNGNNYEFRNLGKLIPADVLVRNPIAQSIANTDFNTMDYEYMDSNNKALIIFILKHNPSLLANRYTSEYSDNFKKISSGVFEIVSKNEENPHFYYDTKQDKMYVNINHTYATELSSTSFKPNTEIVNQYVLVDRVVQPKGVTVYSIDNINAPNPLTNNIESMTELSRLTNEFKQIIEQQIVDNSDKDLNTIIKDAVRDILEANPIIKIALINTNKKVLRSSNEWEYANNLINALTELREEYSKEDTPPPLKTFVLPNKTITNTSNDIYEEADVVEIIEDTTPTNQENNNDYTYQDFARDNKGREILVHYSKYDKPFKATITGEVETIVEVSDETGKHRLVGIQVKSSTGKLLPVTSLYEIEGDVINKDKLTDKSNRIDDEVKNTPFIDKSKVDVVKEFTKNTPTNPDTIFVVDDLVTTTKQPTSTNTQLSTKENPIVVYVDGSDVNKSEIGYGVNTTRDGKDYSISGAFVSSDLSFLEKDLGVKISGTVSNYAMEMYGALVAIRNTPPNEYMHIKQDLEGVPLQILSNLLQRLGGVDFAATEGGKKQYIKWWKDLGEEKRKVLSNKVASIIDLDPNLLEKSRKTNWEDSEGEKYTKYTRGQFAQENYTKAIATQIVDLILARKGKIKYTWVKGHSGEIGNEKVDKVAKNRGNYNTYNELFANTSVVKKQPNLKKQNIFTVTPINPVDKKAIIKASVSNKYIGFAEGIEDSSTKEYSRQAGKFANVGNYNSNDVVFVSIVGKRGDVKIRKEQQDKTIREALKAIEAGATLITDNKTYVESSDYNEGEKRLAKNLEVKGYNYSEQTVDGQVLGVWTKSKPSIDVAKQYNKPIFIFNQSSTQTYPVGWYSLEKTQDTFIPTNTPTLTSNFLGIANNVNDVGIQAIRDLYERTYGTDKTDNTLNQAIKALEAGATVITNNDSDINAQLKSKGYTSIYKEVKGVVRTVWSNPNHSKITNNTLATQIYDKLGDRTVSDNVVIKSWDTLKSATTAITAEGIISTRIPNTSNHFGNPFSHDLTGKSKNLIKVNSIKEAVTSYIDWVINSQDSRAKWIREQLETGNLKGKPILYYKELNEPSHATALDYLINQYDWGFKERPYLQGIEINSYQDDIGFALTNPIFTSPTGYAWDRKWTPKQKEWRAYMSDGIVFNNTKYRDVEEAYQKNKDKYPIGEARDNLMTNLLVIKLQTYPLLVDKIKEKGGIVFINSSTHNPTKGKSYWETGHSNGFIKALGKAYVQVTNKIASKHISITPEYYTKDTPKSNPNTAYVFTEHINGIGTDRSGGNSAVIRGNPNAIGIVTKKYYVYKEDRATTNIKGEYNQNFQDTEEDFELFKQTNISQFAELDKYNNIVFPQGFGTDLAAMPTRFALWLQQELKDRYGLITELNSTKTGLLSIGVEEKVLTEKEVLSKLPKEIVDIVTFVDEVPSDVASNKELLFAMKNVFETNNITDAFLINWAGINKPFSHPNEIKSESHLTSIIQKHYNKKLDKSKYVEFNRNKLAEQSFDNWVNALEQYPLPFRDTMLKHAIKHITNPNRRAKYVLELSKVALSNIYNMLLDKPHEMNRLGKLYDQEVVRLTANTTIREDSESGTGYWITIPQTDITNIEQFKINVDLLRRLSPSTWCTANNRAEEYVANFTNYLLIVNGMSVVGIEARPDKTVKEVTSINNDGVASVDYLDDTLAFFDKHGLDKNNEHLLIAISRKNQGVYDRFLKKDTEISEVEIRAIDRHNREIEYDGGYDDYREEETDLDRKYQRYRDFADSNPTIQEVLEQTAIDIEYYDYFNMFPEEVKANFQVATAAIEYHSYNIAHIDSELPFYMDLVALALQDNFRVFEYLPDHIKEKEIVIAYYNSLPSRIEFLRSINAENINLPFSKTNNNLIQGYYNPLSDKVVVVRPNTPISELAEVVIHEVAHRGMIKLAKDLGGLTELHTILMSAENQLITKSSDLLKRTGHNTIDELIRDYGFDVNTKEGKTKLLMELAARWAETLVDKPKPTWWRTLLNNIGEWIKKYTNVTLTETGVDELIGDFVKYGTTQENKELSNETTTTQLKLSDIIKDYEKNKMFVESLPTYSYVTIHGNYILGKNNLKKSSKPKDIAKVKDLEAIEKDSINERDIFNIRVPFYILDRITLTLESTYRHSRKSGNYRRYLVDTVNKQILMLKEQGEKDMSGNFTYKATPLVTNYPKPLKIVKLYESPSIDYSSTFKDTPITTNKKTTTAIPSTFTYKGKTISTRFQLSPDQTAALEQLIDFYNDPNRNIITLQGAAGTGKTAIVGYLQNYVGDKVLYSAPTHAATLELAFGIAATGITDFPLTSKQLVQETEFGYILGFEAKQILGYDKLIVVDEVSMLNNEDYVKLLALLSDKSNDYKILFIGDEKQIPEVAKKVLIYKDKNGKEVYGKYISKAFFEHETISLNTVHRTSNEGMKKIYQATRDTNQHIMYAPLNNTDHIHFTHNERAIMVKYKEMVMLDPENTDYITYRNEDVRGHNKSTREQLFKRTGIVQKNDVIMGYISYRTKKIKGGNIANSVSYTVTEVTEQRNKGNIETIKQIIEKFDFIDLITLFSGYKIEATSKRITALIDLGFKLPPTSRTIYVPLSNEDAIEHNISKELMEFNNIILSSIFEKLITLTIKAIKKEISWREVYSYKANLSLCINNIDLGNNYIYDVDNKKFVIYNTKDEKTTKRILSKYKELRLSPTDFLIEKGIDYGHAITIHKAQGRTTKNVFFNAGSIPTEDTNLYKKTENGIEQINTENQALYYVGISRASNNLYVATGNKKTVTIDITPTISSKLNDNNNAKEIENNCG